MRILIIAFEFYPITGGAGTNAANLAKGFSEIGMNVDVLTYNWGTNNKVHDELCPYRIIRISGTPPKYRWEWFLHAIQVSRWLKNNASNYKIILLADWVSQVLVNLLAPFHHTKFSCCVLGSEINAYRDSLFLKILSYRLYDRAQRCLCISDYTRSLLKARYPFIPPNKVNVVNVPIDFPDKNEIPDRRTEIRSRLSLREDDFVLFQLSRVVDRKGHRYVIEALAKMTEETRVRIKYIIGGHGPLIEPLRTMVRELGVEPNVKFIGFISDIELPAFYDACDVFIMPSVEAHNTVEGFGIVYLEAALRGKLSIGSRHGAVPEVVINGETGILIDPENSDALREKIIEIAHRPDKVKEMGYAAEKRAKENFSCINIAKEYERLFNRL